ncbi:MAG: hypothetical protein MUP62_00190 [Dehalococcoidia bacterium]|nr:hypothetical protein [Dehalococcoidia bacterium]
MAQDGESEPVSGISYEPEKRKGVSRKIVALVIVAMVAGASGLFVWYEYFRPWSTRDIAKEVIDDPLVATPGFDHSLAGKEITVKGKVTNTTTYQTTLGNQTFVELDNFEELRLQIWGDVKYELGDRIKMKVRFEWSECNDERHVFSPQVDFPNSLLPFIGVEIEGISRAKGMVLFTNESADRNVIATVFDQFPPIRLSDANCSLRAGTTSFAAEYMEAHGAWLYGREIDKIANLTSCTGVNGTLRFFDSDLDNNISSGDRFEISGPARPNTESGVRTYLLIIGLTNVTDLRESSTIAGTTYIVMTDKGLLRILEPINPYARITSETVVDGVESTFVRVMKPVPWNDLLMTLEDGTNFVEWHPTTGELDNWPNSTANLGNLDIGPLNVSCTVVDVLGNGILDEGDCFILNTWLGTSFAPSQNYTVRVLYEPMGEQICGSVFHG